MSNVLQPAAMSVAGGSPQSTTSGTQFNTALSASVKDSSGNAVGANLPVTFAAPDGYFTDTNDVTTTALTNASGVAAAAPYVASSTVGGQYAVTASALGNTTSFTLSNTIKPATITATAGTPQTATAGTAFAVPLQATVMDGSTPPVPVPNAVVTFTAPTFTVTSGKTSAASGTFADTGTAVEYAWTDSSGVATATTFTADAATGTYNVAASVVVSSGTTLSVNFSLTNQ
jgi:hypothetical protein